MNIKRALITVYYKENLENFANFLNENGVEIISTGGTANYLESKGINVVRISEYTGFPEILDGRVKSLHPKLFGGILSKSDKSAHEDQMGELNIPKIDMVIVNFQPFEEISQKTTLERELIEYVDIGGVALLRAAAKNYKDVVPVVDPEDYESIIDSIEDCGDVPLHTRRKLSLKAFYNTSKYDSNVHKIFSELFASEKYEHEFFEILGTLRYGSNPLQDGTLMKFAEKDSILDHLYNLTPHKSPTLRIVKDLKILFNIVSKSDKEIIAFAKKGVIIVAAYEPNEEDLGFFKKHIEEFKGGIIFTENENFIMELAKCKMDAILTTKNLDKDTLFKFKCMVFKMEKFVVNLKNEYIVDEDVVIKQEYKSLELNESEVEKIGFEVAKKHKSDTIVYCKDNFIFSGVQNSLNRKVAIKILESIVEDFEIKIEGGTLIFDSPINSDFVVDKIRSFKIEKIIIPSSLPKDEIYLDTLRKEGIKVVVTTKRYHKY